MRRDSFKKIVLLFSNPKIFICTMLWMMVLVVLGTLAQRDLGLYEAQQRFFSCWISWFGPFPTPGGRTALFIMTTNLIFFMLKPGFWSLKKIGIITIHTGVLLLLLGGALTAWFSSEGNMVIQEGESSDFIVDLFSKELVIIDSESSSYDDIISISENILKIKNPINNEVIPFDIEVIDYHTNCEVLRRTEAVGEEYKGLAQNFLLKRIRNEKEVEVNRTGITFRVSRSNDLSDGIY